MWWALLVHACDATPEHPTYEPLVAFVTEKFTRHGKKAWPQEVRPLWDDAQARGPITSLD
jgi:hypothetical protein